MKSLVNAKSALITTIGIIAICLFYFENSYQVVPLVIISALWMLIYYQSKAAIKKNEVVFERVEQLKVFSVDLQVLINKELALVQEDVIRTRQIVSESISMLQNSNLEISNNINTQQKFLESLQSLQGAAQENNNKNINDVSSNINSILELAFSNVKSVEKSLLENKDSLDNMMIALQFEDIVSQISERVAQHVGDIRATVNILSRLCESEFSTTFQDDIDNMKSEYQLMKEKMVKISSKNLAAQKNMDEGDIELF